jgi:hypothetical protein
MRACAGGCYSIRLRCLRGFSSFSFKCRFRCVAFKREGDCASAQRAGSGAGAACAVRSHVCLLWEGQGEREAEGRHARPSRVGEERVTVSGGREHAVTETNSFEWRPSKYAHLIIIGTTTTTTPNEPSSRGVLDTHIRMRFFAIRVDTSCYVWRCFALSGTAKWPLAMSTCLNASGNFFFASRSRSTVCPSPMITRTIDALSCCVRWPKMRSLFLGWSAELCY